MPEILEPLSQVTIYADGACEDNPGRGGWAAIVRTPGYRVCLSGGVRLTTNNRMEVQAVLEALRSLGEARRSIDIVSDSRYVIDAIRKGWLHSWVRAGFVKKDGTGRENADLWREMHQMLAKHEVRTTWIRGHAGHRENEECDRLAVAARRHRDLPADTAYENACRRVAPCRNPN